LRWYAADSFRRAHRTVPRNTEWYLTCLLMMVEVGVPVLLGLFLEIHADALAMLFAG
jgi:hypothetical protein